MHNYFTDLILKIDLGILVSILLLIIAIITYTAAADIMAKRRSAALLKIKKNVYGIAISGTNLSANVCAPVSAEVTSEQFLDIATNRGQDSVFFNADEQKILKKCFAMSEKTAALKRRALRSFGKWRRIEALISFAYSGDPEAVALLKRSSQSSDEDIRYFSILSLGQIKNPESAKTLIGFLKKNDFPRRKIVSILESFPDEPTSEYLVPLLKASKDDIRFWALKLLSRFDPGKYISAISACTKDISAPVRSVACECIGNSKNKTSSKYLSAALKDDSWLVRSSAVSAISMLLGSECIPEVMPLLKDNSLTVLSAVKDVIIAHIDTAMPYIEEIYSSGDKMAAAICTEAVEEAKGRLK